ncbi:uridine kinase [Kineococcus gynurae]|uniref:uridine kinase n=1 Tax=Kineococcus gynurae TaxID=452979 RepID=UPI003D7E4434
MGVDGAVDADTAFLADHLEAALRAEHRPVLRAGFSGFWRPRSVRLEHGRDDPDAFYEAWWDVSGLWREVLDPLGRDADRTWVPSLHDPVTDRASRAPREAVPPSAVLLLTGPFLLRPELRWGFDAVVHLSTSPAAIRRRVAPEDVERVLGGWGRYLDEDEPLVAATAVLRCEDPRHPAELLD